MSNVFKWTFAVVWLWLIGPRVIHDGGPVALVFTGLVAYWLTATVVGAFNRKESA